MTTYARAIPNTILTLALASLAMLSGCISAGDNSPVAASSNSSAFPTVKGVNLNGETVEAPAQLIGSPALAIVAFEHAQQEIINPWLPHLNELEASLPGFHYYELPVINERTASERLMITNGMRMGITGEDARARTITIFTNQEQFIQAAGIPNMGAIYLFVLGQNGEILYRTSGPYDEDKFTALKGVIQGLAAR